MEYSWVRVYLEDEFPACGMGHRWILVRKGPKRTMLYCPFVHKRKMLKTEKWNKITHEVLADTPTKVLKCVKKWTPPGSTIIRELQDAIKAKPKSTSRAKRVARGPVKWRGNRGGVSK